MTTTVQDIVNKAIDRSLLNDEARTRVGSDTLAIVRHLNDVLETLYADASRPVERALQERNDFLDSEDIVVVTTDWTTLPRTYAWRPKFSQSGAAVNVVTQQEIDRGLADLPPSLLYRNNQVKTPARSGDPASGSSVTVVGTAIPPAMTQVSDYIGALTLQSATTTKWSSLAHVGDSYLTDELACWFAIRSGDRDVTEIQALQKGCDEAYQQVLDFLRRHR